MEDLFQKGFDSILECEIMEEKLIRDHDNLRPRAKREAEGVLVNLPP